MTNLYDININDKNYTNRILYAQMTQYGIHYPLDIRIPSKEFIDYTESNFDYQRYNPRKAISRYGLSLTSIDGGTSGVPDLDSIIEYNNENGTEYREKDFDIKTDVFTNELQEKMKDFDPYIFRSHVLKLSPGGFFPPHRDQITEINSFRIIVPAKNTTQNGVYFLIENKKLEWEEGRFYFLDTVKTHCLFNASSKCSYWIVFNIAVNISTFNALVNHVFQ